MTKPSLGAQAGVPLHYRAEQLIGAQRAFHKHLGLSSAYERHRLLGGGVAVLCIDDLAGRNVDICAARGSENLALRTDQDWRDDTHLGCVNGTGKRDVVARMGHCGRSGRQRLDRFDEALISGAGRRAHRGCLQNRCGNNINIEKGTSQLR
jgi:hypothetical protein